ncbi:superoxide dismutase family protein [Pedosphaera parvula]|uniref:Superoxide dismutase [Cu-Zn] n=1 Tax=Pedosphaera parvula (strain Ellin514) TaxID=320771 RepID=B9XB62_PEDPL|nr:superoxide dismutase family protein [Pedosphaera parvula]EEF62747.1 Superoxide dismutase [Pedosphaera parvula Ellin514]
MNSQAFNPLARQAVKMLLLMIKSMKPALLICSVSCCVLILTQPGCASRSASAGAPGSNIFGDQGQQDQSEPKAIAYLNATAGHKANGTVTFTAVPGGVRIIAGIMGLAPGIHAFHIHENGDCSAPDASSAGGHFNPAGKPHGGPESVDRHLGDLGNIAADADGEAHLDFIDSQISLTGTNSIINRSLVVHEGADDYVSQPAGNSGARVACGVIQKQ